MIAVPLPRPELAAVLATAAACTPVAPPDVDLADLYADLRVTAGERQSEVRAALRIGGEPPDGGADDGGDGGDGGGGEAPVEHVRLVGPDRFVAAAGGVSRRLNATGGARPVYRALFGVVSEGAEFLLAFERGDRPGAPRSTAALPAPFALTAPAEGAAFSRERNDIEIAWEPAGDTGAIRWSVAGRCIEEAEADVEGDPGSATVPADTLVPPDVEEGEEPPPEDCDATLTVRRWLPGKVDPAYGAGGAFVAEQARSRRIHLAP